MRAHILGLVVLTLAAAGAGLWYSARPDQPIRIGILHSSTGTMAASELPLIDAEQMAIDEINENGGLLGRPLQAVVADGESDPAVFAREAARLIRNERVSAIFGTWTSASRKAVEKVVEDRDSLLFYPVQYEGLETSEHVVYLGAVPNQQILPALRWSLASFGPRFFLVGSDYVFPRAAHEIIRAQLARWGAQVVGERYVPLGSPDMQDAVSAIAASRPDVVINTLNGDSNIAFFEAMGRAGLTSSTTPVLSFSIAEEELQYLPRGTAEGQYAAWTYFQSIPGGGNQRFIARFRDRYGAQRVTSDPIEAAYVGVHLFADAVAAAGTDDAAVVREQLRDRTIRAPDGMWLLDGRNLHTWKTPRVGRIRADGQFDVVWSSDRPIAPEPFPALRSPQEWTTFMNRLQAGWGGRWERPAAAQ
jgi:urea transport system substrate-binding protein